MWHLIGTSVIIPLIYVLVMTGIEYLARPRPFWETVADASWDLCILGVGVTGGIFSNPAMKDQYGDDALLAAVIVTGINIGFGIFIMILKKTAGIGRVGASICMGLGILAVALPSGLTFWRIR